MIPKIGQIWKAKANSSSFYILLYEKTRDNFFRCVADNHLSNLEEYVSIEQIKENEVELKNYPYGSKPLIFSVVEERKDFITLHYDFITSICFNDYFQEIDEKAINRLQLVRNTL